jgi:hypothetical protein
MDFIHVTITYLVCAIAARGPLVGWLVGWREGGGP